MTNWRIAFLVGDRPIQRWRDLPARTTNVWVRSARRFLPDTRPRNEEDAAVEALRRLNAGVLKRYARRSQFLRVAVAAPNTPVHMNGAPQIVTVFDMSLRAEEPNVVEFPNPQIPR